MLAWTTLESVVRAVSALTLDEARAAPALAVQHELMTIIADIHAAGLADAALLSHRCDLHFWTRGAGRRYGLIYGLSYGCTCGCSRGHMCGLIWRHVCGCSCRSISD